MQRNGPRAIASKTQIFAALLLLLLPGCRTSPPGPAPSAATPVAAASAPGAVTAEDTTPVDGDWLQRRLNFAPNSLNPLFTSSESEQFIAEMLQEGLLSFDAQFQPIIGNNLAASIDISEDHRVFTFHLKPWKWHDGDPITADDFLWAREQILNPEVPAFTYKAQHEQIESVEKLDDLTLRVTLKDADAIGIFKATIDPLPSHVFIKEKAAFEQANPGKRWKIEDSGFARNPVGAGPYKFVSWDANNVITLERWADYQGPRPHLAKVVFKVIQDDSVAFNALQAGDIDEMRLTSQQYATQTDVPEFKGHLRRDKATEWSVSFVGWNIRKWPQLFGEVKVRRALAMAVDIKLIIEKLRYGLFEPSLGIFAPTHWCFNPDIQALPFDPAGATRLLAEAGWSDGDGDGVLEKDGKKFSFELYTANAPKSVELAEVLKDFWRRIGVEAVIHPMDFATLVAKNRDHELPAWTAGWGTGVDPDYESNVWMTDQWEKGRNYGGYSNPEVDRLFREARKLFTRAERAPLYAQIQKILYDEQSYLFLYHSNYLLGIDQRFRDVKLSPRGPFLVHPGMSAWWVPKALQKFH